MTTALDRGDRAPPFTLTDRDGNGVRLYSESTGQPVVLIFAIGDAATPPDAVLHEFPDAKAFVITDLNRNTALPFDTDLAVLFDEDRQTATAYSASDGITVFLLDANLRIAEKIDADPGTMSLGLGEKVKELGFPDTAPAVRQAPVLLIPRVLDTNTCRLLIDHLEADGGEEGNTVRVIDGDVVRAPNFDAKRRRDLSVTDPEVITLLQGIVGRRVLQEMYRAFQVKMTYVEEFKLGCYEAKNSGFFRAHRDNTTPATRHRQFAMTLNLNSDDFEGGELRFPEYGSGLYKPETGEAIVFSCTLMHEVMPVRAGRRYTLLSFFHDDAGEDIRAAYLREHGLG